MKKIILGLMGIILTIGLVSGTAYALFSDTVAVSGISITAGNADLRVIIDGQEHEGTITMPSQFSSWTKNLYPGKSDWGEVSIKNNSTSDIGLKLSMRLIGTPTNWWDNSLKDLIKFYVTDENDVILVGWTTLAQWRASDIPLNITVNHGETEQLKFFYTVDSAADNGIAGKSISGVTFQITGTQTPNL